jgi:hypothetical protein
MDEREHKDFDARLLAKLSGPQRPSAGVEQLWGVMGRPGVPAGATPRRRPPGTRKVGERP